MKEFVCGRCGKTFTTEDIIFIRVDSPNAFRVIDFEWVDVCPDCCAEFEEWWKKDREPIK